LSPSRSPSSAGDSQRIDGIPQHVPYKGRVDPAGDSFNEMALGDQSFSGKFKR
jgi:hypothetical protein